jgi:hypothetical protein
MRVTIHLTHHRGIRLGDHQHHPRGELTGELLTYQRTSKRGVLTVATLRDLNYHGLDIADLPRIAVYHWDS